MTKPSSPLPSVVRIGHLRYRVIRDNTVVDEASVKAQVSYAGFSNSGDQRIAVRTDLGSDYEAETVLHEVLHQCLRVSAVDPDKDAKAGVADVEERAVAAIAGPLLAALRDNPDLVLYLLDDGTPR
jgi:hypothetical protein